jgi:hypothetical protein
MAYPLLTPIDELADIAAQTDEDLALVLSDIQAEQQKRATATEAAATLADVQAHLDLATSIEPFITLESDTLDGAWVVLDFTIEGQTAPNKRWLTARVDWGVSERKIQVMDAATGRIRAASGAAKILIAKMNDDLEQIT